MTFHVYGRIEYRVRAAATSSCIQQSTQYRRECYFRDDGRVISEAYGHKGKHEKVYNKKRIGRVSVVGGAARQARSGDTGDPTARTLPGQKGESHK